MPRIEGGCLCGAVRYTSEAEPMLQVNCYCENCRKNTGGSHSVNLAMPAGSVTVTGPTKTFVDRTGASGEPFNRHFCPTCGSPVRAEGTAYDGIEFIKAGTLDDASWVEPTLHIWDSQRVACAVVPAGAETRPKNP